MEEAQLSRSINLSVTEGALATVMTTLLSGAFLTAFGLQLGASELQIGLLAATTPLAHLAQLGGAFAIERFGHRKQFCLAGAWINRLLWVPILLATRCDPDRRVWYIVALLSLSCLFGSMSSVAWLSWIKDLIPPEIRLRFLARRHVFNTLLAFSLTWLAAFSSTPGCGGSPNRSADS